MVHAMFKQHCPQVFHMTLLPEGRGQSSGEIGQQGHRLLSHCILRVGEKRKENETRCSNINITYLSDGHDNGKKYMPLGEFRQRPQDGEVAQIPGAAKFLSAG